MQILYLLPSLYSFHFAEVLPEGRKKAHKLLYNM
nr:MAG TPA: hypothetical protein [Caudoviricetes sp.]DAO86960.1 MAG TPA: hypothetical protein [Caudoviricetes sp.]